MQILGEYFVVRWFDVAMEVLWMGFVLYIFFSQGVSSVI